MKRKEEDEKIVGPMFPRLHVNDRENGGPRAPPRNKMALYERLTIPSQSVPSTSLDQGTDRERRVHLPLYQRPFPPSDSHHELQIHRPEGVNLSNQPAQLVNMTKPVEEDELVVPIFSLHGTGRCTATSRNSGGEERGTHPSASHAIMVLDNGDKKGNDSGGDLISRQHVMNEDRRNSVVSDAPRSSDILRTEKCVVQRGQQKKCKLSCSEETEVGEGASNQSLDSTIKDTSLKMKHNPCKGYGYGDANGIDNGGQRIDDGSLERENGDRGDDVSDTSMVDSACAADISADNVVAIIGVKNFWRARTAIANQQRVLAAQVFELHRLMKVQGLVAGSPHFLLEGQASPGNKASNAKKCSSEFAVKALPDNFKQKDDSENPEYKLGRTSENPIAKAPLVSAPVSSPSVNTDPEMNPWSFHQPGSHQWLMPVMCPSEGLVYKPCPTPGFVGPVFGGYGPVGPNPVAGNLMYSAYGMPMGIHSGGQGYFPPYAMPVMSPGMSGSVMYQMNQFSWPDPSGQMGWPAGVRTKNSCNGPIQMNECIMPSAKDLRRSTASSPSKRTQGPGTPVTEISQGARLTEKRPRVIRVVPYEAGSTRESAARIFESIKKRDSSMSPVSSS